jgi:16S rRNA A1518/A1519 N6-dimethyltransferase RsmA/KsgA/DIM1 with predicted DNA glycosylase/AP lyase activity
MATVTFSQDPLRDQVFLEDAEILRKVAAIARLKKKDTVLEVGAGDGRLTEILSEKCSKVIAVEMDGRLRPALEKRFSEKKNVTLIFGNALEVLPKLAAKYDVVVSNPPYAISEPLVRLFFGRPLRQAVLTLPCGFVSRLAANREDPEYSKLSLFVQSFFKIESMLPVGRDAWTPVPRTDSVVVRLTPKEPSSVRERISRALAMQEDKKLSNALREALAGMPGGTKRKGREKVSNAGIRQDLLEKKVASLSLKEVLEVLEAFG